MKLYVCMYKMCEGEPVKPLIVYADDKTDAYNKAKEEIIKIEGSEPYSIRII